MWRKNSFIKETAALRSLKVLEEIEKNPTISQRSLAKKLGVALGVANACVHTLVRKGFIKIRGKNNRSITYHLTKKGLLHKSMLAMEWTKNTIDFYREARQQIAHKLNVLSLSGVKRVVLFGAREHLEIAVIVAHEAGVEIVGITRRENSNLGVSILGVPVEKIEFFLDKQVDGVVILGEVAKEEVENLRKKLKLNSNGARIIDLNKGYFLGGLLGENETQ
jgi:DNA-binding MarR family transcriptional regulator